MKRSHLRSVLHQDKAKNYLMCTKKRSCYIIETIYMQELNLKAQFISITTIAVTENITNSKRTTNNDIDVKTLRS